MQLDAGGATSADVMNLDARAGILRAQSLQDPAGTRKIGRPGGTRDKRTAYLRPNLPPVASARA